MANRGGLAILVGGLTAATVDIGAACLITGLAPERLLQTIAGGLWGAHSFSLGSRSALLGLLLQELMGLIIASAYVYADTRLGAPRNPVARGVAYGVVIFVVMNFVVVPLSAWRSFPHFTIVSFAENLAAMLLFGVIIALAAQTLNPPKRA